MTSEEIERLLSLDPTCLNIYLNSKRLVLKALIRSKFDIVKAKKLNGLEDMTVNGYQIKIRRDFFIDATAISVVCKEMHLF